MQNHSKWSRNCNMKPSDHAISSLTILSQLNEPFERGASTSSKIVLEDSAGYYSDEISSDLEAELYSEIHYQPETKTSPIIKLNKVIEKTVKINNITEIKPAEKSSISINKVKINHPKSKKGPTENKILEKRKKSSNAWPVIGSIIPISSLKTKKSAKMTDSECEVITIKRPEEKVAPIIVLSSNSSEEDTCDSSVIVEDVIQINVVDGPSRSNYGQKSMTEMEDSNTLNISKVTSLKRKKKARYENRKKRKESLKGIDNDSLKSVAEIDDDENLYPSIAASSDESDGDIAPIKMSSAPQFWKVSREDKPGGTFKTTKYYKAKSIMAKLKCKRCNEFGHLTRYCTKNKKILNCFLCGIGGHNGKFCINPVCTVCLIPGHTLDYCHWKQEFLTLVCTICKAPGHLREECPDLWRRYHLTNGNDTNDAIVKSNVKTSKPLRKRYCSNCGNNGHFVYECRESRMHSFVFPLDVNIVNYNEPSIDLPLTSVDNYASNRDPQEEKNCKGLFIHKHRLARIGNQMFSEDNRISTSPIVNEQKNLKWGGVWLGDSQLSVDEFFQGMLTKNNKWKTFPAIPIKTTRKSKQKKLKTINTEQNTTLNKVMDKKRKKKVQSKQKVIRKLQKKTGAICARGVNKN